MGVKVNIHNLNSIWWCEEEAKKQRDRLKYKYGFIGKLFHISNRNSWREDVVVYPYEIKGVTFWAVEIAYFHGEFEDLKQRDACLTEDKHG